MIRAEMRLGLIRELVFSTSDASFAVDGLCRIVAWNSAAESMFGVSPADAIGRQCHEIVQASDDSDMVCSATCTAKQSVGDKLPVGSFDLQVRTADGPRWCNISLLAVDGRDSASPFSLHIVRQIDSRKRLELLAQDFIHSGTGFTRVPAAGSPESNHIAPKSADLSTREREVLKLLSKGVTTTAVGEQLHISRTTVNNHVQHILHKLGVHTRMQAIRSAERSGLF